MTEKDTKDKTVLVGVLKDKRDFDILMRKNWYRIPANSAPKRKFDYLAFYQPLQFGEQGKHIIYFARVLESRKTKRVYLLPDELNHPRANDDYICLRVGKIRKLIRPIKNTIPRRIIFGFTTLSQLYRSKNILELYNVAPTEQIVEKALKQSGAKYTSQFYVLCGKKRFRLDFAIFCKKGKIAIECDNKKAHSTKCQKEKDRTKNKLLEAHGWTVMRFTESKILYDLKNCLKKVKNTVRGLGGQS